MTDLLAIFAAAAPAAGEAGNVVQEISRTFGLNLTHFISQVISFSIVALCLHRFAYKPILKVLEDRRQTIAESLANAEKIKEELARTEAARREILARANEQAAKLIEEARAAAARLQEQETQKAIAAAEQILARSREAAQADYARMLAELRREVGRLVVQTTARVTGKVLTLEDQRRLAEEAARQLAA
jgi:F-type H+-transporting ATPase subunit b